jgi:hypothetical protein
LNLNIPDIFGDGVTHHVCRCHPYYHGHPRYDWIAVNPGGNISDYNIAQLRLLFIYKHEDIVFHLACIQHFQRCSEKDPETRMTVLERTEMFEVIPITSVVRNVHLIPYFDSPSTAQDTLKAKKDVYSFKSYILNHYSDRYSYLKFN